MVVFLLLLLAIIVAAAVRADRRRPGRRGGDALAERFARGDIDAHAPRQALPRVG